MATQHRWSRWRGAVHVSLWLKSICDEMIYIQIVLVNRQSSQKVKETITTHTYFTRKHRKIARTFEVKNELKPKLHQKDATPNLDFIDLSTTFHTF